MTLISLRSQYHVNASMVLTRADHLFICNELYNNHILHFRIYSSLYCITIKYNTGSLMRESDFKIYVRDIITKM